MSAYSPFDHRPDKALGRALRELLTPDDHRAFVTRIVVRAEREFRGASPWASPWEVLSAWTRPGLAAVVLVVIVTLFGLPGRSPVDKHEATLDDALGRAAEGEEQLSILHALTPPDVNVVLASGFEN
jgi:hypothetical protein